LWNVFVTGHCQELFCFPSNQRCSFWSCWTCDWKLLKNLWNRPTRLDLKSLRYFLNIVGTLLVPRFHLCKKGLTQPILNLPLFVNT
jgi:hypothetical protein